jgi:hypothetical protein
MRGAHNQRTRSASSRANARAIFRLCVVTVAYIFISLLSPSLCSFQRSKSVIFLGVVALRTCSLPCKLGRLPLPASFLTLDPPGPPPCPRRHAGSRRCCPCCCPCAPGRVRVVPGAHAGVPAGRLAAEVRRAARLTLSIRHRDAVMASARDMFMGAYCALFERLGPHSALVSRPPAQLASLMV